MSYLVPWHDQDVTYDELAREGAKFLSDFKCDDPHKVARQLLCLAAQKSKTEFVIAAHHNVSSREKEQFFKYLCRFKDHEPVSRIEGRSGFYGLEFVLSPYVFDPRPETELLIDLLLQTYPQSDAPFKLLDIGTGSGCLAITAAKKYPLARIKALEICRNAVIVARNNAKINGVSSNVTFIEADLLDYGANPDYFDVIICNPPYIPVSAKEYLDPSVTLYDPDRALFYGDNGLGFYEALAQFAQAHLVQQGRLIIEFGIGQAKSIKEIFYQYGYTSYHSFKDQHDIIRAAIVAKESQS